MKIALISDLHSNREALDAVFADIAQRGVEHVYCLGDVVGYGPEPEYCVDLVMQRCKLCLMGNHDEALFRDASDFNPHARGAIDFTRERMFPAWYSSTEKKARWKYLRGLPLTHNEGRFLFVHGSPRDPVREYVLSTDGFLNPDKLRAIFESFDGVALGDKMLKAGITPLAAGNAGTRFVNRHYVGASFSCCAGPDNVYQALSGKLPWNDPSFVESIQLLKDWWDKGYFGGQKYFALSMQQSFALMAAGKSGMALQGSWAFQWVDETFKKTGQDLDWVPIPKLSSAAPYPVFPLGIGADLAINAASQVPEGAAKVLNALLDHKFIVAMSEAWGGEWDSPLASPPGRPPGRPAHGGRASPTACTRGRGRCPRRTA